MIGSVFKGIGSSLAGSVADVAGISSFTSALGVGADQASVKTKARQAERSVADEAPTKVLQRIFTEVKDIHKVIASQIVPAS